MIDAEALKGFFTSDGMKELLAAAMKEKFTLNPEKMQNPQEVSDLYKGIYEKMDRLMQQMSNHTGSSGEHLSESAKGMQERIDFLQNLSNLFPYAQIPVRMEGGDSQRPATSGYGIFRTDRCACVLARDDSSHEVLCGRRGKCEDH